ncbi:MAG: ATP-binding protein, partial [Planctomycetota bacterium]|nr:ATP-binding protein [Planctomycetota bacterium]
MSYRSIKRVLGETNLERKCRFLFGASLFLLLMGSFLWYGKRTAEIVNEQNPKTGRLLVHTIMMHHWKHLETNETFKPVVEELITYFDKDDYEWNAIRPESNKPKESQISKNKFERELLAKWVTTGPPADGEDAPFAQREKKVMREQTLPNGQTVRREVAEYHYYQPVYIKSDCVLCHRITNGNNDLVEGDLQAIIQVRMPLEETHEALNKNLAILLATAILTVFLAMILLYVIIRYVIVKPLNHLRDVSNEISRGNTSLRAEINTRDEFEDLAVAFNRMLQQLLDSAAELRQVNDDLDANVDELAQANMRLFEMNRLKNDFLATMSHELRTPLNSILGFSDVLSSIESLDEKQRRYVDNIQTSGRLLLDMINDILDLAKVESGKMEMHLADFPLSEAIQAPCDMARPLAEKKNLDLETFIQPSTEPLHQDRAKLQQILNNLLSNAIKFTPEGGRIEVIANRNERDQLEIVVRDTGVGIADEDQLAIFEKFRQGQADMASDAMTREYSGTGLGLSIVKELCKLLGGEITLQSELGKGSSFCVKLPWIREEQPKLESPLSEELHELTKP